MSGMIGGGGAPVISAIGRLLHDRFSLSPPISGCLVIIPPSKSPAALQEGCYSKGQVPHAVTGQYSPVIRPRKNSHIRLTNLFPLYDFSKTTHRTRLGFESV